MQLARMHCNCCFCLDSLRADVTHVAVVVVVSDSLRAHTADAALRQRLQDVRQDSAESRARHHRPAGVRLVTRTCSVSLYYRSIIFLFNKNVS